MNAICRTKTQTPSTDESKVESEAEYQAILRERFGIVL
jgi:hypothetical protein